MLWIKALTAAAGSERLPDAVPMICEAGDVFICNRQLVHGSFANSSPDRRITLNEGFFPRHRIFLWFEKLTVSRDTDIARLVPNAKGIRNVQNIRSCWLLFGSHGLAIVLVGQLLTMRMPSKPFLFTGFLR